MVGDRIQGPVSGDRRRGPRTSPRRAAGLELIVRDGTWHVFGTVRLAGLDGRRRSVRVRKGTGLPAGPDTRAAAETLRDTWALEIRHQVIHGVKPSRPLSVALEKFLARPRDAGRKPGWREIAITQEIARKFGVRMLNEISAEEWNRFVETRCEGRAAATRERYLNGVMAFLNWCHRQPREWLSSLPHFERNASARKPKHRQRRRVAEWRPELIQLLIDSAGKHLKPQLWMQWSTGQRVSAVLKVRLCDVVLAKGREQVTFGKTKTGEPVTASLHPAAGEALREYLKIRGRLWNREGPLFLTRSGEPYKANGLSGQNRTAFAGARARAQVARRRQALEEALQLRRQGQPEAARAAIGQAWADLQLMRQITQHWFRHLLATTLMARGAPVRVGMDQGGWLEVESYMAYAHDVPEVRRSIVADLPIGATAKKAETA